MLLRHLRRSKEDGSWGLSEETSLTQLAQAHAGSPIVHLQFRDIGTDLVLVDANSKVSIFTMWIGALNYFFISCHPLQHSQKNEDVQPVGLMWMANRRPNKEVSSVPFTSKLDRLLMRYIVIIHRDWQQWQVELSAP